MGLRVLIVDDSSIVHKLLTKLLEKNGHTVCGNGKNGKEGVELYKSLSPDIVFLDITMPILEGTDALKLIVEHDPKAKVIMLSAMGDKDIQKEAEEYGVSLFLKKPFDEYKIISAIAKVI